MAITTPAASAEIYLQGAHVTAWAPVGERPVLWTSRHSKFAHGEPIRGGIPVCFPWFGPAPAGEGPLHGVARVQPWVFLGWDRVGSDVVATFAWESQDAPHCPQSFALRYTVTVGARLRVALHVTNKGREPLTFEEAFHTYLAVGDVREATLQGLDDLERLDRRTGYRARTPQRAELRVVGETDHLYREAEDVSVIDWAWQRVVRVHSGGSANCVVWNPWADKASAMSDFGDDEWSQMVCVETCNVADGAVRLDPGATHVMTADIEVRELG